MTDKEKEEIKKWLDKVNYIYHIANNLVKYPCSGLGSAMDMLCDTLSDFPFDLE